MLRQDITTLEARKAYLESSIGELSKSFDAIKLENASKAAKLRENIDALVAERVMAEKSIEQLQLEAKSSESNLHDRKQVAEGELKRLAATITDKNMVITGLGEEIEAHKVELIDAQKKVVTLNGEIDQLASQIPAKKLEVDSEIAKLESSVAHAREEYRKFAVKANNKQDELESIDDKLTNKQNELRDVAKKHQEFLAYEKRSVSALEAREAALLEKEEDLDTQLTRARRRNSVLDKIE